MSDPGAAARAGEDPEALLRACGLVRAARGRVLLGPVDLAVFPGETVAIVGPNGAGKTTLLRLLAGVESPTRGEVRLDGRQLASRSRREVAQRLVYLPQHPPEDVPLPVDRYLRLARYAQHGHRLRRGRDDDLVERALAATGTEALRDRPLALLSGGERQLVQLAGALVQGGALWLVDEPTAHLDPAHQRQVAQLLAGLTAPPAGERGLASAEPPRTLVLATHDLNLAARLARRVVALVRGVVAADGAADAVLSPERLQTLYGTPFRASGSGADRRVWLDL